jgi:cation:H+ antiporter
VLPLAPLNVDALPMWGIVAVIVVAAIVIAVAGTYLAGVADRLADRTGLGEAIVGALLLGAGTSLPGILTSVVTAWNGYAQMAISNGVGGLAAQTVFLVAADLAYRKVNLEHAAASVPNILNAVLLISLLGLILIAASLPEVAIPLGFSQMHPVTPVLFIVYALGLRMSQRAGNAPQWKPKLTAETKQDDPDEDDSGDDSTFALWAKFVGLVLVLGVAGFAVAKAGEGIVDRTPLGQSFVGAAFTAVATSLPELVTSIAAVRRGALTLAVGNIIGGNAFDTLFVGSADIAYRPGSIYHAVDGGLGAQEAFLIAVTVLMTAILTSGLVAREKKGAGNIGFESVLMLVIYVGTLVALATAF